MKLFSRYLIQLLLLILVHSASAQDNINNPWHYTTRAPDALWNQPSFDDDRWQVAPGGFGTADTPNSRVFTTWDSSDIWLRKKILVDPIPSQPALLIYHDEDAQVFLNGKELASFKGFIAEYRVVPISPENAKLIRAGENLLAVHCHQTNGGQFIDVHLIDANAVPKLPAPPPATQPTISPLITTWGEEVNAENAWTEYPRPQMQRKQWVNLNGHWDYAVVNTGTEMPTTWDGQILVPYPIESKLSGVQRLLAPTETLWYRRTFNLDVRPLQTLLLNFEAVDYRCQVWVNGQKVGEHVGGNDPFSLDITNVSKAGENTVVVQVQDATNGGQLTGKQRLKPQGIWYTRVSGIWQTVWLESVAKRSVDSLQIKSDARNGHVEIAVALRGKELEGEQLSATLLDGQSPVASASGKELKFNVPSAKLWSPNSPHLYDLNVVLKDAQGNVVDEVQSYVGIRAVGKAKDSDGHWRFTLNDQPIFHWGPLDQGWWPDGLLTPPSDEALQFEIQYLKDAGFNMIRKHIKVEPRRYYYHCDKIGMMVWQDQVSGGANPDWTRFQANPQDATWRDEDHQQFMHEFERMIQTLDHFPCIVVWTPFNEAWGQHRTMEVGAWAVNRDPTRLINIASGGNFWPVGDIADWHEYPHPKFPFDKERFGDFILVVGEFGGHGWPVQNHLWEVSRRNWGYGGLPQSLDEYKDRFRESIRLLIELKSQGIAAGVYTQTTDVEGEINGLLTYDRKVKKISEQELKKITAPLLD
jgi:hypothetical protein